MTRPQWILVAMLLSIATLINYSNLKSYLKFQQDLEEQTAKKGERLQPMAVFDASDPKRSQFVEDFVSDSPQIIFVLSPSCRFCFETIPSWRRIVEASRSSSFGVLALSIRGDPRVSQFKAELGMQVFVSTDRNQVVANKLLATPQTILVDKRGNVESVWTGVLSSGALDILLNHHSYN